MSRKFIITGLVVISGKSAKGNDYDLYRVHALAENQSGSRGSVSVVAHGTSTKEYPVEQSTYLKILSDFQSKKTPFLYASVEIDFIGTNAGIVEYTLLQN